MSTVAPAADALRDQATKRFPDRITRKDGSRPDENHKQNKPRSWHLPRVPATDPGPSGLKAADGRFFVRDDERGVIYAVDLSHSPAQGLDVHEFVRDLVTRGDCRVMEVISNREKWTLARADEGWRPHKNEPHDDHVHITIDPRFADDVSPWWKEEEDMTPEQAAKLDRLVTQMSDVLARVTDLQEAVDDLRVKQP